MEVKVITLSTILSRGDEVTDKLLTAVGETYGETHTGVKEIILRRLEFCRAFFDREGRNVSRAYEEGNLEDLHPSKLRKWLLISTELQMIINDLLNLHGLIDKVRALLFDAEKLSNPERTYVWISGDVTTLPPVLGDVGIFDTITVNEETA